MIVLTFINSFISYIKVCVILQHSYRDGSETVTLPYNSSVNIAHFVYWLFGAGVLPFCQIRKSYTCTASVRADRRDGIPSTCGSWPAEKGSQRWVLVASQVVDGSV